MAKVTIQNTGNPNLDGEYEFDPGYLTNRELHQIKQIAGVRPMEFDEAFAKGDNDLAVAFALIALHRNGKPLPVDVLWDLELGAIKLDLSDPEAEAEEAKLDPPNANGDDPGGNVRPLSSGATSGERSVPRPSPPPSTGRPRSATTAT